eukprot:13910929-Alexandrium_andersonii.AAC.1
MGDARIKDRPGGTKPSAAGAVTDTQAPTSSHSTDAGREKARAATVIRRANDSASDADRA